jgi:hypothetical protein
MYYGQIALASDLVMESNDGSESTTESEYAMDAKVKYLMDLENTEHGDENPY